VAILNSGSLQRSCAVKDLTASNASFRLCSDNTGQLFEAVTQYEAARNVRLVGDAVHVDLLDGEAARLNRYLAGREIYLHELTRQRQTLEQAFLAATRPAPAAEAGEHA
jgi:signal transduction histidine kinase